MSASLLGLPQVPPELKSVLPYLQRADELSKQDPMISYWCTYYAAQIGISLKARDNLSRDFLLALLGTLEKMKASIGPADAIDLESVSSAYVENFALKVFSNADNEDRAGRSTRSTAKKFLAAANFLEVLKTFPKADVSDSTEEKIRYSKWKAADIAKAFREGRKPTPGPPGWAEEQEELKRLQREQEAASFPTPPELPIDGSQPLFTSSSSPQFKPPSPPRPPAWRDPPSETWSSSATPGTASPAPLPPSLPVKPRRGSVSTINASTGSGRGTLQNAAWTDAELEGPYTPAAGSPPKSAMKSGSGSPESDKRVHFASSNSAPSPKSGSPQEYAGPSSIYAPSPNPIPPPTVVVPPHTIAGYVPGVAPPSPPRSYIYAPPAPVQVSPTWPSHPGPPPPPPPTLPAPVVELTPSLISKAQKHCRFAISSLDYEDAAQARKELRAALALLGG